MSIKKRYDFLLAFDVKDGNPNGNPDAGNLPRIDSDTSQGLVTDVCIKRKLRNYVQLVKKSVPPFDIYVKERSVLARAHVEAFQKLSIDTGQSCQRAIPAELLPLFDDLELPEGLQTEENGDDQILAVASDVDKNNVKEWAKNINPDKKLLAFINAVVKEAKPRKPSAEETERGRAYMCKTYFDIRAMGAVLGLASAPNCGQVRGPLQFTFGRSIDPVMPQEHSITRVAVATEKESKKQFGLNQTMGRKTTIPYGLYVTHGFVSANFAEQTGFDDNDLALVWDALRGNMFDHDRSSARGEMNTCKLIVFEHDNPLGNASAFSLFKRIKIERIDLDKPARAFEDYRVTINTNNLQAGVKIMELV